MRAGRHTKKNTTWSITCEAGDQGGEKTLPISFQNCTAGDRREACTECSRSTKKEPLAQPRRVIPGERPSGPAAYTEKELG